MVYRCLWLYGEDDGPSTMLDPTGNERGEINERGRGDPQLLRGKRLKCALPYLFIHILGVFTTDW